MGKRKRRRRLRTADDLHWRSILSLRSALRELVEGFVPGMRGVWRKLDFDRARKVPTTLFESSLRALETDAAWRVPVKGGGGGGCLVYVLVEQQNRPLWLMALRIHTRQSHQRP